jgi:hypothetical protein
MEFVTSKYVREQVSAPTPPFAPQGSGATLFPKHSARSRATTPLPSKITFNLENIMKDREIVSLRHRATGRMVFGHVTSESESVITIDGMHFISTDWHIHRNLAAMPHEDFGRKIGTPCQATATFVSKDKDGTVSYMYGADQDMSYTTRGQGFTFLDETPDIKITVEIGGKISTLSDISEETLLKIRSQTCAE